MSRFPAPFSSLPPETARADRWVFNLQSCYLALGDQLEDLVGDLDWDDLGRFGPTPVDSLFVQAMITIFQFSEDLADCEAASAAGTRMDWKYALHLPVDYPGLAPGSLAEFRRHLEHDPAGRRMFQALLGRLARLGLLTEQADVDTILSTVDAVNCLKKVREAIRLALGALVSHYPDWQCTVEGRYWHQRYGPASSFLRVPHTQKGREALLKALETDLSMLLAIVVEKDPALLQWAEVHALEQLWRHEFGSSKGILARTSTLSGR